MEAYYPELGAIHVGAVAASGMLFLLRALALNLTGASWPLARPARVLAYAVDTTLLAAAIMLMAIVRQYPFVDSWLTAKILLLVVYIFLGYRALRAPGRAARASCLVGAAATFLFIVSVARAHNPLGLLTTL